VRKQVADERRSCIVTPNMKGETLHRIFVPDVEFDGE